MSEKLYYKGVEIVFDAEMPSHDFDPDTDFCRDCGVPLSAVVDGIVIPVCGQRYREND